MSNITVAMLKNSPMLQTWWTMYVTSADGKLPINSKPNGLIPIFFSPFIVSKLSSSTLYDVFISLSNFGLSLCSIPVGVSYLGPVSWNVKFIDIPSKRVKKNWHIFQYDGFKSLAPGLHVKSIWPSDNACKGQITLLDFSLTFWGEYEKY